MQPITHTYKQGTSLWFGCELLDDAGAPASGLGVDVACTAEHKASSDTRAMTLVWIDRAQGRFELWAPGAGTCSDWATGMWLCDVQCTREGAATGARALVLASETIGLMIQARP